VCVRLVIDVEMLEGQKGSGMPKMADTHRFMRKCFIWTCVVLYMYVCNFNSYLRHVLSKFQVSGKLCIYI
jgi:hypothetical protein